MSKIVELTIDDITGGWSPTEYLAGEGQFLNSIAIDPELPVSDSTYRASGIIRPSAYEKFSSTALNSHPIAYVTNPKTTTSYTVLGNGKIVSYNSSLASEATPGTVSGGVANGAHYYNDYIYIAGTTNISRYGALSGTPSLTDGVWTSSTLGSQTALTNTTYPTIGGISLPNHWMHEHADNKLYVCDYKDGQGLIHFIKTNYSGTNDGSTYNALDLPFGYYPTSLESLGNDLVIGAVASPDTTVNAGKSGVFFWDTVATSFDRFVPIPGTLTALKNINGVLYAISGNLATGHTVYVYLGENTFKEVCVIPDGHTPFPGAVDSVGNRLLWGTKLTDPASACVLMGYGSKQGVLKNALNCVGRSTLTPADGYITAVKHALHGTMVKPTVVMGGKNSTAFEYYLEKPSTTYQTSIWRSRMFNLGTNFNVKSIEIPLATTLGSNMTIVPKLYIDDKSKTSTLRTINSTNYADTNTNRRIVVTPETDANGQTNFFLELSFTGTALVNVALPIKIIVETHA